MTYPLPSSKAVPTDLADMTEGEVRELALAYLDLLKLMTEALEECDTDYGFFDWSGQGFHISGHPPLDLVERLTNQTKEDGA